MVQMYAKKVLLPLAFLPIPSIFVVSAVEFGPVRILQTDAEISAMAKTPDPHG